MAYMGQERAMGRRIGLFDAEPILPGDGDDSFTPFFTKALSLARHIKESAPLFDARLLAEGVVLVERRPRGRDGGGFAALFNLDGRSGRFSLPEIFPRRGEDLITGTAIDLGPNPELSPEPLVMGLA